MTANETPNENAFFTLVFDKSTMQGVTNEMVCGDCTAGSLMGNFWMPGEKTATSLMHAFPLSLSIISTVAPVPVPATA